MLFSRALEPLELAQRYFSAAEAVNRPGGPACLQAFFRFWSLKEAALKSIGEGIPFGLDLRKHREQVTVVVDEFGGAEGIVSIEDIIEEVVEEIEDEYDTDEPRIRLVRHTDDGSLIVNRRIDIAELEEELGVKFPRGRYASLGGFLLEKAGDIPALGTRIEYKDLVITVVSGTAQSIREVKIRKTDS